MSRTSNAIEMKPLDASERSTFTLGLAMEDARLGLKYHLLRLSLLGLTDEDQKQLHKLASLVFADKVIDAAVAAIKERKSASKLAIALADIVESARDKRASLLGAVFGAYSGLGLDGIGHVDVAILGAIAGSVAITTNDFVTDHLDMNRFLTAE